MGSSQTLQNVKEIPRLTGWSCGEFPGIGRTLPSRRFWPLPISTTIITNPVPVGVPMPPWLARVSAFSAD